MPNPGTRRQLSLAIGNLILECRREPHVHLSVLIRVDEVGHKFGMTAEHFLGFLHTEHHERGGIGIGCGAVGGDDRRRQKAVLNRVAGMRINGVGQLPATVDIEVAIVAARGHGLVGNVEDGLQFLVVLEAVVGGFRHPNLPRKFFSFVRS